MSIRDILESLKKDEISIAEAEKALRLDYVEKVNGHTVFDHARKMRKNVPEVVYALPKTPKMVADVAKQVPDDGYLLISRASKEHYDAVAAETDNAVYHESAS
ncbi:MAG: hypothetical protein FWD81_06030, partial [Methanomassiliicoccaceae archaeon]|nr:hypothetical protein [Methanomassiliicoccaceae archaeon]